MTANVVNVTSESSATIVHSDASHSHSTLYYTKAQITALLLAIEAGSSILDETLSTDESYSGPTSTITVGENVVFGDFLYRNLSDNKYYKAQADAVLTAPAMRMALATALADATCLVLCPGGIARLDTWNWTDDGTVLELYLSSVVAGDLTESLESPPPSNSIGQVVAIPLASNKIEFCPSLIIARF